MRIKLFDGLLDKYEENPPSQLSGLHPEFSLVFSGCIDISEVKSMKHPMAEEYETNVEAYIME